MRFFPRSIRNRMLALSAGATLLVLVIAGLFIADTLERFVTRGIDQRLDAQIALLASTVSGDGHIDEARLARLPGLLKAGRGWYWRIEAPGKTLSTGDFPSFDRRGDGPRRKFRFNPDGPRSREGRDRAGMPVHARQFTLRSTAGNIVISVSAPRAVIDRPIRDAMLPLLLLLAVLCGLLIIAGLLQIRFGLRPLLRLRDEVAAIRAGRGEAVSEEQPEELRPLAQELNALTRDNHAALETARASAANLAHALKTPVAALAVELRNNPELAGQVARIDATIRHHLSRARGGTVDRRAVTILAPVVADLAATIARIHVDRPVAIETVVDTDLAVTMDVADLNELLGNLIDNAMRHAQSRVAVTAAAADGAIQLNVADDGPGIAVADRENVFAPGTRLDERGDGHGFGLSIAREIAELYGGSLSLGEAPGGGNLVNLTLPGARIGPGKSGQS